MRFHFFTTCLSMATFSYICSSHSCNSPFAVPNHSVSSSAGHCYGRTLSDNLTSHLHCQSLFLLFFDKNNKAKGSQHNHHHLFLGRMNDRRWMLPDKHVMSVKTLSDLFYIIPIVSLLVQDKDNILPLVLFLGCTFAVRLPTRTITFILFFNISLCFLTAFTLLWSSLYLFLPRAHLVSFSFSHREHKPRMEQSHGHRVEKQGNCLLEIMKNLTRTIKRQKRHICGWCTTNETEMTEIEDVLVFPNGQEGPSGCTAQREVAKRH